MKQKVKPAVIVTEVNVYMTQASKPIRTYVPLTLRYADGKPPKYYVPSQRIMYDPIANRTILERSLKELENWVARYQDEAEVTESFAPVLKAYAKLRKQMKSQGQG